MGTRVIRYRPKADRADENQRLVEAVFEELNAADPGGIRYVTYRLADGTFIHVAAVEGEGNPLDGIAAFGAFVEGVGDRCEPGEGPYPQQAIVVGSYGYPST